MQRLALRCLILLILLLHAALAIGAVDAGSGAGLKPADCVRHGPGLDHSSSDQVGSLAWHIARAASQRELGSRVVLATPGRYDLKSSLTIPEHVTLHVCRGAMLRLMPQATLTMNGSILAGPWRIFEGKGAVNGDPQVDYVRPQWWGKDQSALVAALKFRRVYLGRDTFTVGSAVPIGSNTYLFGEPGSQIVSTVSGNPHTYFGLLTSPRDRRAENIRVEGIKFKNTEAIGLYALFIAAGGATNVTFTNCEAEGCCLVFAANAKNITISDNRCHSSTLGKKKLFDDHHDGIYLAGATENCIIKNNRILDRRCHGIAVVAESVFPPTSADPTREMLAKRILVDGNTVVSGTTERTAGGIWFSCVQDCRVVNNHVEGYGDVGIDFEGSRACVADSNVLVNNARNLALFGNCRDIIFSNNLIRMTRDGQGMAGFLNSYSNGYKDIVDLRNSDILVVGNTFTTEVNKYNEQHGTGNIIAGTARRICFKDNAFVNCRIVSHYCDDLQTIEITGNSFYNDFKNAGFEAIRLAASERGKTLKQPAKSFIITGNTFRCVGDSVTRAPIIISTVGVLKEAAPYCDLSLVFENNVVQRQTTSKPSVLVDDNYQRRHHLEMRLNCIIRNNVTNSPIALQIPKGGRRKKVDLTVEGNVLLRSP